MRRFCRTIGSLNFALFLIGGLALILTVSTSFESFYGTPMAQETFYQAHWFDFFLGLVWLNIFCATLTRWPFQKKHIGFVLTHLGILILLVGSLLTRLQGEEGQMTLFENEAKNRMIRPNFTLNLEAEGKKTLSFDFKAKAIQKQYTLPTGDWPLKVDVLQIIPHALEKEFLEETAGSPPRHAAEAELSSEMLGLSQRFSILEEPGQPVSTVSLGPATFVLQQHAASEPKPSAEPSVTLRLSQGGTGKQLDIPIKGDQTEYPWNDAGLTIKNLKYYPKARVVDNRLVSLDETPEPNPAVEFEVIDTNGHTEHHTRFSFFPEFNSLRGGDANNHFNLNVTLDWTGRPASHQTPSGLYFLFGDGENWKTQIVSSKTGVGEPQALTVGQPIATGWMDMKLNVLKIYRHAAVKKNVVEDPDKSSGQPALRLRVRAPGHEDRTLDLLLGRVFAVNLGGREIRLSCGAKTSPLPFNLWLRDFRKIDYPGTSNPSSFESDVTLRDSANGLTMEKTIKMNKPLDYAGYRIFQSSYVQDPDLGEASVFTIAKNPGIAWIYFGACLILAGVILLFYFHPFFSGNKDNSAMKEKAQTPAAKRPAASSRKGLRTAILSCLLLFAGLFSATPTAFAEWDEVRMVPIQHNGRIKPFDSFSRQTLKLISNKESWNGKSASEFMLELMADRAKISSVEWIVIDHSDLKKNLELDDKKTFFALQDFTGKISKIQALAQEAASKRRKDERPAKVEQKAEQLLVRIRTVEELTSGAAFRLVPAKENQEWITPFGSQAKDSRDFGLIIHSYEQKDRRLFSEYTRKWMDQVDEAYPKLSLSRIQIETLYNNLRPFEFAALLYFLAFILYLFLGKKNGAGAFGFWLVFLAFFFHSFGLACRIFILNRPPVSNMYESMIFMNWMLIIFAMIFSTLRRSPVTTVAGCAMSGFVMLYANLLPIDSSLDVVVAVLRSNYWLTIHVLTIVASYGAFGLAMALGHRHLFLQAVRRLDSRSEEESARIIYKIIELGVILIGAGTFLGGVWANESWGRFWGWDPKETWALITFLGYLFVVHLKIRRKVSDFAMALTSILGFQLVLMTWYGVNFVLGRGLHSYGSGSGGTEWIVYYLAFEALFLLWVFSRKKR